MFGGILRSVGVVKVSSGACDGVSGRMRATPPPLALRWRERRQGVVIPGTWSMTLSLRTPRPMLGGCAVAS